MRRKQPEAELQRAICKLLAYACNPGVVWFAVPNGGARSKTEAAIMKGLGVQRGVPDLAFVLPPGRAAFLELKAKGGKVKKDSPQAVMRARIEAAGGFCAEADTIEKAIEILRGWHVVRAAL